MPDPYTYEGTEVLRNKFGITDPLAAHELETRVSHQRLVELSDHPVAGEFDFAHLQAMHRRVYSDLWDWAGQIRTVDTGTTNTGLAHRRPEFIQDQARIVFGGIKEDNYLQGMDQATIADRLAYHWGETTALHPFRDGNTRSQRLFFHQLTTEQDGSIDWYAINAEMDQFKHARLVAPAGNHEPLRDVLAPTLRAGPAPADVSSAGRRGHDGRRDAGPRHARGRPAARSPGSRPGEPTGSPPSHR